MSSKPLHTPFQAETLDELYALLLAEQQLAGKSLGGRSVALTGCLATWLIFPGPWGSTALCLAGLVLVACMSAAADLVARSWFMHAVTLHHLMGPRYDNADLQMALWATLQTAERADGEA